jgi:glyoxylase-like metal-dependent hydrolase (beta-lactamase superfamily II)
MSATDEIVPGIHRWTCPHPEYRTRAEQVVSYALVAGDAVALVDPLLPLEGVADRTPLLAALDELAGAARRLEIMVTIPYHTRSAEVLFERYWGDVATRLWGNAAVAKRFVWDTPLTEIPRGTTGTSTAIADGLAVAFTIGNPKRQETPLYFPVLKALAFGDVIVGMSDGSLRVWNFSNGAETWHRTRFLPTLEPLAKLEIEAVLVTHGPPVTSGGRRALQAALDTPPVTSYW